MRVRSTVLLPALLGIALYLLSGAPRAAAGPETEKKGEDVHKAFNDLYPVEFRVKVNKSIDKGVKWLIQSQRKDGSWSFFNYHRSYPMGSSALAVLTLLKCGTPKEHPAVVKGFAFLRGLPLRRTYSVAVLLMALDAKYAPARDPFAIEKYDRYGMRTSGDPCANKITPEDLAWMREGAKFLTDHQKADGYWRYPTGGFDTSNTQFALLGLHAATRCGVKVSNRVWLDALRFMLGFQQKSGEPIMYKANEVRGRYRFEWTERAITRGFAYASRTGRATASMTTAGLTCLVICQSRLWRARAFSGQLRLEARRGIRDAMAWLQANFAVSHNPGGDNHWTFYNIYGLERAGVIGRYRFLGLHDWYKEGAEFLFTRQHAAGYWVTHAYWEGSCFALLFLKRATSRMKAPVITPSGSKEGEMPAKTTAKRPVVRRDRKPRSKTELAIAVARAIKDLESRDPDVVFLGAKRLGILGHRRAVKPLVRLLKLHRDPDVRVAAAGSLGKLYACNAFRALVDALNDRDPLVRYAAQHSIGLISRTGMKTSLRSTRSRNDRVRLQKMWREWWAANEAAVRNRLKQPKTS